MSRYHLSGRILARIASICNGHVLARTTRNRSPRRGYAREWYIVFSLLFAVLSGQPATSAALASPSPSRPGDTSAVVARTQLSRRPDHLAEQQWFYRQRALPHTSIPQGAWQNALQQRAAVRQFVPASLPGRIAAGAGSVSWTAIGPAPTNSNGSWGNVSGRVTALAYDQAHGILYAGGADGGLWKSANGGATWTALSDNQPSLAISAVALDPTNPQTIYLGTGEDNFSFDAYYGAGILKTTDGGATWTLLGQSIFDHQHISKVVVDPHAPQHVLVASDIGLWLSTNGGSGWTEVLGNGYSTISDLVLDASTTPSTIYAAWGYPFGGGAATSNGIYKSTNGGATFTASPFGVGYPTGGMIGRIALALAPTTPQVLYMVASDPASSQSMGVWMSRNGGATWSQTVPAVTSGGPDLLGNQGWYDEYLAVDPTISNTVYVSGIDVYKSTDSANTFTNITNAYAGGPVHPDEHALVFNGSGSPQGFYVGNDGGVYGSSDGGHTWTNSNGNLAITQFYAGSTTTNYTSNDTVYGGSQDNGSQKGSNSALWSEVLGGDGGFTANDPNNPAIAYAEFSNLQINKTTDGGLSWASATNGINPGGTESSNFIAPFIMDPGNPSRLLAGTNFLYETTDGAANWTRISPSLPASPGGAISAIAIAPSMTSTIYAATDDGKVWVTTNDGGAWQDITAGTAGANGRYPTSLAASRTNPQDVLVTFSGFAGGSGLGTHIYRSTTGGTSWSDISTGLPDSPVTSVVRDPANAAGFSIGADDGFFFTADGGATWEQYQTGLPNAGIDQLFSDATYTTLVAATHGRGMFTLPTSALSSVPAAQDMITPLSLTYGPQVLATSSIAQTITVSSTGQLSLTVSSVSLAGNAAADFAITSNSCTAAPIAPQAACTIGVDFAPATAGNLNASLVISDNAALLPQTVALTGTGIAVTLAATPPAGAFQQNIAVTGSNFGPHEQVQIFLDSVTATLLATTTSDASGSLNTQVTVPQATGGSHNLVAHGQSSGRSATTPFQINPKVLLTVAAGSQGSRSTLSGYGFGPGEPVTGHWGTAGGPPLGTTASNTLGSFVDTSALTFTVPISPFGSYAVFGVGQNSHLSASVSFHVTPALTLAPPTGPVGSSIVLTGTGYGAQEMVTVQFDCATNPCHGKVLGSARADANGTMSGLAVTIPFTSTGGRHVLGGRGASSTAFATTSFVVLNPTLAVSPTMLSYHATATVSGTNFGPGESVKIYLDSTASTPLTTTIAGADGSFLTPILAPPATVGAHTIVAAGQRSGQILSARITVKATVNLNIAAGPQGATVVLSGFGFAAHETVQVRWNSTGGTILGTATSDAQGSIAGATALTFTVPISPVGTYRVFSVGRTSQATASALFSIVPTLTLAPRSGLPGSALVITGTGYAAHEAVQVTFACGAPGCPGGIPLGMANTDTSGGFSGLHTTVPTTATVGTQQVGGTGLTSHAFVTTTFTVK